jgi:hypothetical protein
VELCDWLGVMSEILGSCLMNDLFFQNAKKVALDDFTKKVLEEFAREKFTNEHVLLSRNHKH